MWGLLTIYWKQLTAFNAVELIGWRIASASVVMAVVVTVRRRWPTIRAGLRRPSPGDSHHHCRRVAHRQLDGVRLRSRSRPRHRDRPRVLHGPAGDDGPGNHRAQGTAVVGAEGGHRSRRRRGGRVDGVLRPAADLGARHGGELERLRPAQTTGPLAGDRGLRRRVVRSRRPGADRHRGHRRNGRQHPAQRGRRAISPSCPSPASRRRCP